MIQEREAEIGEIETGIHELHEIFRELGTLVQEQGGMLGAFFFTSSNSRLTQRRLIWWRRQHRIEHLVHCC